VLLLLPASGCSVRVAVLPLAPRAAAEASARLACFERLLLPHATKLLTGAATGGGAGGGGGGAAEGAGLWRLCGLLLAEQVAAAEQGANSSPDPHPHPHPHPHPNSNQVAAAERAAEPEAALLRQAASAQWRRLLGAALDPAG